MIGVLNYLRKALYIYIYRFHYHSWKVIGSLTNGHISPYPQNLQCLFFHKKWLLKSTNCDFLKGLEQQKLDCHGVFWTWLHATLKKHLSKNIPISIATGVTAGPWLFSGSWNKTSHSFEFWEGFRVSVFVLNPRNQRVILLSPKKSGESKFMKSWSHTMEGQPSKRRSVGFLVDKL